MKTIAKSVSIRAPVEQVWAFLTNPENLPSVWPSMTEVSNVVLEPNGKHHFDFTYRMAGIMFHGHADTLEVDKYRHVIVQSRGGVPSTFNYSYAGKGGTTKLFLHIDYVLPGRVLAKLAEPLVHRINEREAALFLHNVKEVIEHRASLHREVRPPM